jgi:hypothetical protein
MPDGRATSNRVREIVETAAKPWVYVDDAGDGHPATYGLDAQQIAANILQALDDAGYEVVVRDKTAGRHPITVTDLKGNPTGEEAWFERDA